MARRDYLNRLVDDLPDSLVAELVDFEEAESTLTARSQSHPQAPQEALA